MRFRYTILYVQDVGVMIDFYARAFGFSGSMPEEAAGDYGELDTGDTVLAFSARSLIASLGHHPGTPDPDRPVFELALETEDVPASYARAVEAGAVAVQEPTEQPWGQTISYVRDPEGYLIEICSPMG